MRGSGRKGKGWNRHFTRATCPDKPASGPAGKSGHRFAIKEEIATSAVGVAVETFFLPGHGAPHVGSQRRAVSVLVGPHALQVKKSDSVAVLEEVIGIGLKTGHGTEIAVDEGDAPLFGGKAAGKSHTSNVIVSI